MPAPRPAASKAPLDYLFALVIGLVVIGLTFFMKPPTTRWLVFGIGVIMVVAVLAAALKPVRR